MLSKRIFLAGAMLLGPLQAYSLDLGIELGYMGEHTDNVRHSADDEESETIHTTSATLNAFQDSSTIQADVNFNASHVDYAEDLQEDQDVIEGLGTINWTPLPDTFEWFILASIRDQQTDRRETDTLENREERSIYATGPTIGLRLSKVDRLTLALRHTITQFQESENSDNSRNAANTVWAHRISESQNVGLGASYTSVEFDDETQPDIENSGTFITYSSALSQSQLTLSVGYNESKRENGEPVNGPSFQGLYTFKSGWHQFNLLALNVLTDSTIGVGDNSLVIAEDDTFDESINDSNFEEPDIVERTQINARYSTTILCRRCTAALMASYLEEDYDIQPDDFKEDSLTLDLTYQINILLSTRLTLREDRRHFLFDDREDDNSRIILRFIYQPIENLSLEVFSEAADTKSTDAQFEYNENRYGASIRYQFQ